MTISPNVTIMTNGEYERAKQHAYDRGLAVGMARQKAASSMTPEERAVIKAACAWSDAYVLPNYYDSAYNERSRLRNAVVTYEATKK